MFINCGTDEALLKSLVNNPLINQEELSKAMSKEGLVQVQVTVNPGGGKPPYTRMQWKKASDVKEGEKVVGGDKGGASDAAAKSVPKSGTFKHAATTYTVEAIGDGKVKYSTDGGQTYNTATLSSSSKGDYFTARTGMKIGGRIYMKDLTPKSAGASNEDTGGGKKYTAKDILTAMMTGHGTDPSVGKRIKADLGEEKYAAIKKIIRREKLGSVSDEKTRDDLNAILGNTD